MAQLPRYQEMGLIAGDQPRLQFAEQQEQARFSAGMAQQLNRLSSFAFGIAAERQAQENRILGIQMRAELEGEVQKQLSDIKVRMETGQLNDITAVQQEILAMQGLVKPLAEVDTNQANMLMTSIASGGRQLMAKSSDSLIKLYQEQAKAQLEDMFPAIQNNISTVYDTTFNPQDVQAQKAEMRNKVYAMVASTAPDLVPLAMKEFDARWNAARDESLIGYFTSREFGRSPATGVRALREGNAGKYTDVWRSLGVDEQNKIIKKYLERDAQEASLRAKANSDAIGNQKTEKLIVLDQYFTGAIGGDEVVRRAIAGQFDLSPAELKAIRTGDQAKAKEDTVARMESLVISGQIGEAQIDQFVQNETISLREANTLRKSLRANMDKDTNDGFKLINSTFDPNPLDPLSKREKKWAADGRVELLRRKMEAEEKGLPFNGLAEADKITNDIRQREDYKLLEKARNRLTDELSKAKVTYGESYTNADLKRMGVDDNSIGRILRLTREVQRLK